MMEIDFDYYENIILYNALTDETYLSSIIDELQPKFFEDRNISKVLETVVSFYKEYSSVPTLTELKPYLNRDDGAKRAFKKAVRALQEFDEHFNQDELYKNTEKFLQQKAVYYTFKENVDKLTQGELDPQQLYVDFEKACNLSLDNDIGFDYFNQTDEHIQDLLTKQEMLPTGYPWLDEKLGGGFVKSGKALYVFAGEVNMGKSNWLANLSCNLVRNKNNVLLLSYEMPSLMYAKRISANLANININQLSSNTKQLERELNSIKSNNKSRLLIKEFPPSTITVEKTKAFISKLVKKNIRIDAIFLDYLSLLKGNSKLQSFERVKEIAEQVRALTYYFGCPLITAAQINRGAFGDVPGMEDTAESIGLPATADAMFGIYGTEEDFEQNIINLCVMKNRFGPKFGTHPFHFDPETLRIVQDDMALEVAKRDVNAANTGAAKAINALEILASRDT